VIYSIFEFVPEIRFFEGFGLEWGICLSTVVLANTPAMVEKLKKLRFGKKYPFHQPIKTRIK
jgi:hypothetical protein